MEIYIESGYEAVAKAIIAAVKSGDRLSIRRRGRYESVWIAVIENGKCRRNEAEMAGSSPVAGMHKAAVSQPYPEWEYDESIWDTYGRRGWEYAHWVLTGVWRGPENLHPEGEVVA